jgi:hypothetical protein
MEWTQTWEKKYISEYAIENPDFNLENMTTLITYSKPGFILP